MVFSSHEDTNGAAKSPAFGMKVLERALAADGNHIFSPENNTGILKPRLWPPNLIQVPGEIPAVPIINHVPFNLAFNSLRLSFLVCKMVTSVYIWSRH